MKAVYLLCVLLCTSLLTHAQVQFWNLADVEDEQWLPARKAAKISQLSIYQTAEKGNRLDATQANEIKRYNANGQLTSSSQFKYSYPNRKWVMLRMDSFYYNAGGQLTVYKGYEGSTYNQVYETQITLNAKNQQTRHDHFVFDGGVKKLDRYDVFEYDAKGMAKKMTSYDDKKKQTGTRLFFFNAGKLVKWVSTSMGSSTTTLFNRGKNNELTSFQEFYDKDLQKTIDYSYDASGHRTRSQTQATSGYDDFTEYRYADGGSLYQQTYLQYSGMGGKTDRRHEYREMVYR